MQKYPTCGCIPYRYTKDGCIEVLMVLNDDEEEHWEFPKGKIEEGESEQETALRELFEETGLHGHILEEDPIDFNFDCTVKGNQYHKTVRYFYCKVPDDSKVQLQEEELGDYVWLPLQEAVEKATYPEMKEAAQKVVEYFTD